MIAILDYDAGNLTSVERAVRRLGFECLVTPDPDAASRAERIIFPGVGAAGSAMEVIKARGLGGALRLAIDSGKPVLGICLGCQVVLDASEENGATCLGLLPGQVTRFPEPLTDPNTSERLKVPHMGWNGLAVRKPHPVLASLQGGRNGYEFYFVHSYYPKPAQESDVLATTTHGLEFASVIGRGSLIACQFHPEKSGRPGLAMLEAFCRWDGKC
jgi:glutamine amidotransferase